MMKFLRKKGVMKFLLWGIAVVVILSFGLLSNAYLLSEKTAPLKHAGKIFGRTVSLEDFQRHYQFVQILARLKHGQNFQQIVPMLNLEEQAWSRLILLEDARRKRISVTDQDVIEAIREFPFFRNETSGKFDPMIYEMTLTRGLRVPVRTFEEGMRDSLKINRLFERQTFTVSVTEDEVSEAYRSANEQARVSYVLFPPEEFLEKIIFDEVSAKAYFLDHKNEFVQPPAVNAVSLSFPFDSAETDSKNQAYENAFETLIALNDGNDFLSAAAAKGAVIKESGFFDMNQPHLASGWPLEILRQLFSMRVGQFTDIVTTPGSYDIIQLRSTRPPFVPGYEQVKDEVRLAWTHHEAMSMARSKAEEYLTRLSADVDFTETALALRLSVTQTPDFKRGQYLPDLGPSPDFQQTAFSLTPDSPLSSVVPTDKGWAILFLEAQIPVDPAIYKEEKEAFGLQVLERKKMTAFDQYFADLKAEAALEDFISEHLKN